MPGTADVRANQARAVVERGATVATNDAIARCVATIDRLEADSAAGDNRHDEREAHPPTLVRYEVGIEQEATLVQVRVA